MDSKKTYVLDTNVLLSSPNALFSFEDNTVIIPDIVLEELDNHKNSPGDIGYNARCVGRNLDSLRSQGNLLIGVKTERNGVIKIVRSTELPILPASFDMSKADNKILAIVLKIKNENRVNGLDLPVLVSRDINVRVKADILDIKAENFTTEQIKDLDSLYTGRRKEYVSEDTINAFYMNKSINPETINISDLTINEYIVLVNIADEKNTAIARFDGKNIVPLQYTDIKAVGSIIPKNVGQKFAWDALFTPAKDAPLVFLMGIAGTAKTFCTLAAGLDLVRDKGEYTKILITRANVKFDNDIGFLKGDENDKMTPLIRFAYDNFENIMSGDAIDVQDDIDELFDTGIVRTEALAYMRGRSINNTLILVDEAQNLTPTQAEGMIKRLGVGSKIVFCGDIKQVDNPNLSSNNNGLVYAIDRMKDSKLSYVVSFLDTECTRSELAKEAAERFK